VSTKTPWKELPEEFRDAVLYGVKGFKGVVPFLVSREKKKYKQYIRVFLRQYQSPRTCSECGGGRIRKEARYVRVGGLDIAEVSAIPLEELAPWVAALTAGRRARRPRRPLPDGGQVAETILRELRARVGFLVDVGLGYLTLDRQTRTLSGGEAQRINLANSLGSSLVDTLYVLDEPTVGLHPRDTGALLGLLRKLSDGGNTVVVVEHDPQAIRAADHVVELGPASGEQGGQVVYEGPPGDRGSGHGDGPVPVRAARGRRCPTRKRDVRGRSLSLRGARLHNVRRRRHRDPAGDAHGGDGRVGLGQVDAGARHPVPRARAGTRGGASSAKEHLGEAVGAYDAGGRARLDEVVLVDQSPIGRTPRSNPVTYVKAWDHVRKVFADQPLSHERGYGAGHFSFNTAGGRCEECKGAGYVEIEMVFMADVYVPCDACNGGATRARSST
jgi:excinuclease ABC subunit A